MNRYVLSFFLKQARDGAERISPGKSFHTFFLFLPGVSVVLTLAMSLDYDSCLTTVYVAPESLSYDRD